MQSKGKLFLDHIHKTQNTSVEFYVEGLGWLILLKDNIEIVSDNWFASTKYLKSSYESVADNTELLDLTNVYVTNASFVENANNVKYNMLFDHLFLDAGKIVAFH